MWLCRCWCLCCCRPKLAPQSKFKNFNNTFLNREILIAMAKYKRGSCKRDNCVPCVVLLIDLRVLIKHCFLAKKNHCRSQGLINIIQNLQVRNQQLISELANLNVAKAPKTMDGWTPERGCYRREHQKSPKNDFEQS
jgi:hypothetical protein